MTKLEDRLSIVGMLLHQSYDDGKRLGYEEGYKEGYDVAKRQAATVAESK